MTARQLLSETYKDLFWVLPIPPIFPERIRDRIDSTEIAQNLCPQFRTSDHDGLNYFLPRN